MHPPVFCVSKHQIHIALIFILSLYLFIMDMKLHIVHVIASNTEQKASISPFYVISDLFEYSRLKTLI